MAILLIFGKLILALSFPILLYLVLIPIGGLIPINRKFQFAAHGVDIFLSTNGMHTDFILPTNHPLFEWKQVLESRPYAKNLSDYPYLGIGCGDRAFYLELISWAELTPRIAAEAMLLPTTRIMHITGYETLPEKNLQVKRIRISEHQYQQLCAFILQSFAKEKTGNVQLIPNKGYTIHDNFYQGTGIYHAFNTCNYWVNQGLKKIGVRTSLWSPLDRGIFYQLRFVKN